MIPERWEHGSDLHTSEERGRAELPWQAQTHVAAASGREALRQLVMHLGCPRVWVPDYYCRDVVEVLRREAVSVATYAHDPTTGAPACVGAAAGDVVVLVNTWGLRASAGLSGPFVLVEDHTHDPLSRWAADSTADYAFASLRKAFPLPDGGVVWSPRARDLPTTRPPSEGHLRIVERRREAMERKAAWLRGADDDKAAFRALFIASEEAFADDRESGMDPESQRLLESIPTSSFRARRAQNFRTFAAHARLSPHARLLEPDDGAVPFAATLLFDDPERRDRAKARLVSHRVYPAVLWPLDATDCFSSTESVALSKRVLSVHCDARYTEADMVRVANLVNESVFG